jgi:hypothetical protein
VFGGRVAPAASRVTLRPERGERTPVRVGGDGRFRARAAGLRRGQNRFVLEARAGGMAPWTAEISITRR